MIKAVTGLILVYASVETSVMKVVQGPVLVTARLAPLVMKVVRGNLLVAIRLALLEMEVGTYVIHILKFLKTLSNSLLSVLLINYHYILLQ